MYLIPKAQLLSLKRGKSMQRKPLLPRLFVVMQFRHDRSRISLSAVADIINNLRS